MLFNETKLIFANEKNEVRKLYLCDKLETNKCKRYNLIRNLQFYRKRKKIDQLLKLS